MWWCVNAVIIVLLIMCSRGQKIVYLTEEFAKKEGYIAETHHIVTNDGYMLEIYRIPYKRYALTGDPRRPIVLLLHGMFTASISFIVLGRDESLGMMPSVLGEKIEKFWTQVDAGFDVWIGNARGTKNSRFHVTLDPDNPKDKLKFFDFTYEEIGRIDLAEMVDFILGLTGKDQLHFIGHGAGATAFLVLNSMKPEYNSRFTTAHLLGAVGYQRYFKNRALKVLASFTSTYHKIIKLLNVVEVFPPGSGDNVKAWSDVPNYCTGDRSQQDICELMGVKEIMGSGYLKSLLDFETAGASVKQIAHFGHNIKAKKFQRWDHGSQNNLLNYGTVEPPVYNLKYITTNVTFHYSNADHVVTEQDVMDMVKDMPNARARKVWRESFQHFDFLFSRDVKKLVTAYIIQDILRQERPTISSLANKNKNYKVGGRSKKYHNSNNFFDIWERYYDHW